MRRYFSFSLVRVKGVVHPRWEGCEGKLSRGGKSRGGRGVLEIDCFIAARRGDRMAEMEVN